MSGQPGIPVETIAEALRLRGEGLSVRAVGDRLGISKGAVSGILQRNDGITTRRPELGPLISLARRFGAGASKRGFGQPAVDDAATVARAERLWNAGRSLRAIAEIMRVGKDVVVRWRSRYRWTPRVMVKAKVKPVVSKPLNIACRPARLAETSRGPAASIAHTFHEGRRCQYPIGDPRDRRAFRFCNAPITEAGAYCNPHHALCYNRVPVVA